MRISIALPSYNYARFLEECLNSIQEQDYKDFEVLIADGGSTDASLEMIKRICKEDSRFRLISTEDNGQADAIAKALAQASGDVFGYLNADDCYLCRDAFSCVIQAFYAYPRVDLLSFGGYYLSARGQFIKRVRYRYHPLDSTALIRFRTAVLQPATFWKRIVHETIPIRTDFQYVFDAAFFYEAYTRFLWLELPKPIAGYRLHDSNKSVLGDSKRIFELARFERIKFGPRSLRSYYLSFVGMIVHVLGKMPVVGPLFRRSVYRIVNSLAFATVYRLPGI
ncbi:MAG: glycosyltransferase [Thermoanaerobaculia bacterium]